MTTNPTERPSLLRRLRPMSRSAGLSLIEMLIALLVLSFGLLGVAGLQAYSLRNNTSAYHRSQATALAYAAIDFMRTAAPQAIGGSYNIEYGDMPSGSSRPQLDLLAWKIRLNSNLGDGGVLPSGDGRIDCDSTSRICTVEVRWDDTRGAAPQPQEFVVSSRL